MIPADTKYRPSGPTSTLLMHMDGVNGGTTFTDVHGHVFSILSGSPTTSTTQVKFGTASLFTGAGSGALTGPVSVDWSIPGDFTLDMWIQTPDNATTRRPMGLAGWAVHLDASGHVFFYDAVTYNNFGLAPTAGTWWHYACTRSGSTMRGFINGTIGLTWTNGSNLGTTEALLIGHQAGQTEYAPNIYMDEIRYIKGTCVWTSNFTPPTGPYTN